LLPPPSTVLTTGEDAEQVVAGWVPPGATAVTVVGPTDVVVK
jgi:hypothetical protein